MFNPNKMQQLTAPLSSTQFTLFILVPHIACKLIQEDLSCDTQQAYRTMLDSADIGNSLYPENDADDDDDDDDAVCRITQSNFHVAKENGTIPGYDSEIDNELRKASYKIVNTAPQDTPLINALNKDATLKLQPKPRQRRLKTVKVLEIERARSAILSSL